MEYFIEVFALICVLGVIEPDAPMGLVFVLSFAIVLWGAISVLQKNKLSGGKLTAVIVGIMTMAYSVCTLFLEMDLRALLGIDTLLSGF